MIRIARFTNTHCSAYFICFFASLFYVYDYFIQVAPSVMTHQLMQSFSIGAGRLGILSASFYYSYTLMQVPAGALLDRLGARVLLTLAVLASAFGVTLFGVTYSFTVSCFSRFIIGLGSSFSFIGALFLISRWFSHRHFAMAAGLVQLGGSLGSLFGLAPLALLVNQLGWRRSMVLIGLITFCFSFLFWVFIRDGEQTYKNREAREEQRRRLGIKNLLRNPQVWWISLGGSISWFPVTIVGALWGLPYFMRVYDLSNIDAGKLCSLFWVGLGVGSPLMGWLSNYFSVRRAPFGLCFVFSLVGSLFVLAAPFVPLWFMGVALFLLGMSGAAQSLSFGLMKDVVPPELFGTSSGINNMAAILGGAIAQPLVGFLLYLQWNGLKVDNIPVYSILNYQHALLILPVVSLLGIFLVFSKVKETFCRMEYRGSGVKQLKGD